MKVGKVIKKLRLEKGFSQKEFAEMIPMTPTSLSHIEKGNKNPSDKHLNRIAQLLDTHVFLIQFMAIEEKDIPNSNKRKIFKEMSPAIEGFIKSIF